jgi:hypothetical protein
MQLFVYWDPGNIGSFVSPVLPRAGAPVARSTRAWCGKPAHDERALADTSVVDPARTVQTDVNRVLWAEEIPQNVRVSGHVDDVDTPVW